MSARPQLTAIQKEGAGFALAELRRLYDARLSYMQLVIGFTEILDHYALPQSPALLVAGAFDSPAALAAGLDELAGYIERAQIIPAEPVKAAA
jgi:hypothetical protein